MILIATLTAVFIFGYISIRIYRSRKGFYIAYVTLDKEVSKEFDDVLFRESVLKSVSYGFYSFAIENLIFFIITGEWAFNPEFVKSTLIFFVIMVLLHLSEDLRRFVRERKR